MKKRVLLFLFLLTAGSVFAQSAVNTVTGKKLKTTVTFGNYMGFGSERKTIEDAALNEEVVITIPAGSSLRRVQDFYDFLTKCLSRYSEYNNRFYDLTDTETLPDRLYYCRNKPIIFRLKHNYKSAAGMNALSLLMGGEMSSDVDYWEISWEGIMDCSDFYNILYEQYNRNDNAGLGRISDLQAEAERSQNEADGYGSFTNKQLEDQRKKNYNDGYGKITDAEREKLANAEKERALACYEKNRDAVSALIEKGDGYRSSHRFCYALGSYYEAMKIEYDDDYSAEGTEKYEELVNWLQEGITEEYSAFELHDEWKNILIDAEKYGTEYGRYEFIIGKLTQDQLDYKTRTATYVSDIEISDSTRYEYTVLTIAEAYETCWKDDWKADLPSPEDWPGDYSVSGNEGTGNLINGVAIYRSSLFNYTDREEYSIKSAAMLGADLSSLKRSEIYNAFAYDYAGGGHFKQNGYEYCWFDTTLYDLKLNIVDSNGNELVKPQRCLIIKNLGAYGSMYGYSDRESYDNSVTFSGISEDIMKKIDKGEARINLVGVYLEYGKYSAADDTIGTTGNPRAFIKNFPELSLDLNKVDYIITDAK